MAGTDRDIGKMVAPFIMRLAEGAEKNRLVSADGSGGDWQLVWLSSSNKSLAEFFSAAGMHFDDAYRVRFPDISADAGCELGVFEKLHGFSTAADFANELQRRACTYFGTPMEYYLTELSNHRRRRNRWLISGLQCAMARYRSEIPEGSGSDRRITDHFAVVYAAASLAREYGNLPWARDEIRWAVRSCELAHRECAAQSQAKLDPIAVVRSYITANLADFRKVPDPAISDDEFNQAPGFVYIDRHGSTEYVLAAAALRNLSGILSSQHIASTLAAQGLLVRSGGKYVSKVPIRNSSTGRKFAYRIRSTILEE